MRRALILVVALAVLPATSAAAWQELPFRALPSHGPATCLRAAGRDGGLTALGGGADLSTPVDLLAAGAGPPAVRDRVRFQITIDCPVLREQGDVAVAAVPELRLKSGDAIAVALRDAGGAFGRPTRLGRATPSDAGYDAAVSARGDAVVVWVQVAGGRKRPRARILVARRVPGATFGRAEPLTPWARTRSVDPFLSVAAGIDGAGSVTVAWTAPAGGRDGDVKVAAATAAPGAVFGTPQVLTPRADALIRVSLAVAPDGGALLAHDGVTGPGLRLFERPPGAAAFGPGRKLASARRGAALGTSDPALALRDAGAAVVAWRDEGDDDASAP